MPLFVGIVNSSLGLPTRDRTVVGWRSSLISWVACCRGRGKVAHGWRKSWSSENLALTGGIDSDGTESPSDEAESVSSKWALCWSEMMEEECRDSSCGGSEIGFPEEFSGRGRDRVNMVSNSETEVESILDAEAAPSSRVIWEIRWLILTIVPLHTSQEESGYSRCRKWEWSCSSPRGLQEIEISILL